MDNYRTTKNCINLIEPDSGSRIDWVDNTRYRSNTGPSQHN